MSGWTDERADRAKALWSEGKSAAEISRDLGGVSRNAVIGKLHRMGCRRLDVVDYQTLREAARKSVDVQRKNRPQDQSHQSARSLQEMLAARLKAFPIITGVVPGSLSIPFASREFGQCGWIVEGDGADALVCGLKTSRGIYCAAHAAKAYEPAQKVAA